MSNETMKLTTPLPMFLPEGATGVYINGEYIELVKPPSHYRGFFTQVGEQASTTTCTRQEPPITVESVEEIFKRLPPMDVPIPLYDLRLPPREE